MPSDNNDGGKGMLRWSKKKFEWGIENGFVEIKKILKMRVVYNKQYLNSDNEGNIISRSQRPMGVIEAKHAR